jgi:hypothetical protein
MCHCLACQRRTGAVFSNRARLGRPVRPHKPGRKPAAHGNPLCKRFTHWPQAILGAAFNWGMLMAWAEVAGHIPAGAFVMWIGAIAWQIGYDTVYAYVDVNDDIRLGLKSTAILFGRRGNPTLLFYTPLQSLHGR